VKRRRGGALAASPVLVGAVTVLVALVAVFISYSANEGLPFVPTYQLKAEVPNAAKLVEGNDVRAGGFRIGQVTRIRGARARVDGRVRAIAELELELDRKVEPLPVDTSVTVRSRSALGLKYVELVPGRSARTYLAGDTIPLRPGQSTAPDLEDVLSTFQPETRVDARRALQGFGDGLAGRGPALNRTIEELRPFLTRLEPVMRALSAQRTELRGLFPALGLALRQAAPVAAVQVGWISAMADTFEAVGRNPRALQETIEESAPTLDAAIASFQVQTPFLARFADLSRRLQPAAEELPRALPPLNAALSAGVPAFRRTPELAEHLDELFRAAEDLGDNPVTLLALRDLKTAAKIASPAVQFVAPYQTVCNYLNYFFTPLGTHLSEPVPGGTSQRILAKLLFGGQPNNLGTTQSKRPVDTPGDPHEESVQALHKQPNSPAVDGRGRADCQAGQTGYLSRLVTDGRYPPETDEENFLGGGTHVVFDPNTPGLRGGTFKSRDLGIDSLGDVP
jgi:virulence factor Mce-like protein